MSHVRDGEWVDFHQPLLNGEWCGRINDHEELGVVVFLSGGTSEEAAISAAHLLLGSKLQMDWLPVEVCVKRFDGWVTSFHVGVDFTVCELDEST